MSVQLDLSGFAADSPEDRIVNMIAGDEDLTPGFSSHTWDGSGSWTLRVSTTTNIGHGVAFFQDGRPHAKITSVVDNEDGTVTVSYTLYDPDGSNADIKAAFSLDDGATYNACTDNGTGDGESNLTATSGGTPHTFVWDHVTDSVPAESDFLIIITAQTT